MSVYKFACPVCGQHITVDSSARITQMECPTCYRKLHVPPPPAAGSTLVLTTSEVTNRPTPIAPVDNGKKPVVAEKKFPIIPVAIVAVVVLGAAGAVFAFKDKIFKSSQNNQPVQPTNSVAAKKPSRPPFIPPANDTNYTLNLAEVKIPDENVIGRIDGRPFKLEKATLQGGALTFRQGNGKVADVGLTVNLAAQQGEDLAGQKLNIESDVDKAAKVTIRWKDDDNPEKSISKAYTKGYAMRLEFGAVEGKNITGKIYLCTPDKAHSFAFGTFKAEIRKPPPPKTTAPSTGTKTKK